MNPLSLGTTALDFGRWLTRGGGWKWLTMALTAIAVIALYWSLREARGELEKTQGALTAANGEIALLTRARAADAASATVLAKARSQATAEATERRNKTDEALTANPDWADAPVPAAVADSLR